MPVLVIALVAVAIGAVVQAAEPGVKPLGAYPFLLPGLTGSRDSQPRVLLWCHGVKLMGAVVPEKGRDDAPGVTHQNRPALTALLLRDGRCEAGGGAVSFGFLVPLKAWVYESTRRGLDERNTWLLYRFQGSVQDGQLAGVLLRVDVSHPGLSFHEHKVAAEALPESQTSFADENEWHASMARTFSLAQSEP